MTRKEPEEIANVEEVAIEQLVAEAVAAEREACALLADKMNNWQIATAIRNRDPNG